MTGMTRKEYMERHAAIGKASPDHYDREAYQALHREYYGQWARRQGPFPADLLKRCRQAIEAGDVHMNSPFTSLKEWDDMQGRTRGRQRESDGTWSLSFNTCVLKEAARLQIEAARPTMETRHFRAAVRKQGATGKWHDERFALQVTVQGSHDKLMAEAIEQINQQGWEVHHIASHSLKADCL